MADSKAEQPLSPHLQIYRQSISMVMSIVHRLTGTALYAGTLLMTWWLIAIAGGPQSYADFQGFIGSFFGRIVLFGFTWALVHHMLGGVRHFIWDTGRGFELATVDRMSRATLIGSIALTFVLWFIGYAVR